ncbi:MAG: dTMP kinase [Clostridia bacterium]|nr:dTMP kinase [Clostridia bacterium]
MRGKLISFEGCEGSGKSTKLKMLEGYLQEKNIPYLYTREPGGNAVSERIRSVILDPENTDMTPECEALLYAAARVQLLRRVIEPARAQGKLVVCDRYVDSSLAYQGEARGLGQEFVRKINSYAFENYLPDCTVFLDISPEKAFERKHGADENDRIEQAGLAFHNKVYEGYLKIAKEEPNRFIRINAVGTKQETFERVLKVLQDKGIL